MGGDAGALMAVMAVILEYNPDLSVEEAIGIAQAILKAYQEAGLRFHIHTDTHAQEENGIGCGHVKTIVSTLQEEGYSSQAEILADVYNYLLTQARKVGSPVKTSVLKGDHQEKAVIELKDPSLTLPRNVQVITEEGDRRSIQAFVNNPEAAKQVLIFQAAVAYRHLDQSGKLPPELTPDAFFNLVWTKYNNQATQTTQALAKGRPTISLYDSTITRKEKD